MKKHLKNAKEFLLYLFLPRTCVCCSKDLDFKYTDPLCPICFDKLEIMPDLICERCGVYLPSGGMHCHRCRGVKEKSYKCSTIRSAFMYNEAGRSLVLAFKYNMDLSLRDFLSENLISAFYKYNEIRDVDVLIPVPLQRHKQNHRGFNQSKMLADSLGNYIKKPILTDVLIKHKKTKTQAFLNREERIKNVIDAFKCVGIDKIKNKNILLVDDVATTSSTLESCAVELKKNGAKKVYALTLARE